MFLRVPNYSKSLQKIESSQPKYYCIDNGLRDAVLLPMSGDDGKKLENTVFLQLYRHRTPVDRIFYYQGKGECDHRVEDGTLYIEGFKGIKTIGADISDNVITLVIPQGTRFEELDIEVGAGVMEITGIGAAEIEASIGAGELIMYQVE